MLELGGLQHLAASFARGVRDRNLAGLVDLVAEWRMGRPHGDAELGRLAGGEEEEREEGEEGEAVGNAEDLEEGEQAEEGWADGSEAGGSDLEEEEERGGEDEGGEAEAPGDLDALLASGLDPAALEAVRRAEEEVERQLLGRWAGAGEGRGQGEGQGREAAALTTLAPQQLAALEARDRPLQVLLQARCVWRMSRWGRGGALGSCKNAMRPLALHFVAYRFLLFAVVLMYLRH